MLYEAVRRAQQGLLIKDALAMHRIPYTVHPACEFSKGPGVFL